MNTTRHIHLVVVVAVVAGIGLSCASKCVGSSKLLSDASALEAFVDGIVTNSMAKGHIPGAVVAIVHGDRVIFNKGYGFSNLEQQTPVDPDKTLFRIASVSKVFNAMTVMRLVDEGRLDVNEDVRPRIATAGFELDHEEYGPLTLKALLTHTAGIRDLSIPNVTSPTNSGQALPLGSYLRNCLPLRWQEPGESALYTDHGITLAGYVAEVASNTRFQEAVRQKVLQPLAMNHTFYSVPEEQRTNIATAYYYKNSNHKAASVHYPNIDPAVGVMTTGNDMARLMICHLSGCKDFLKPETAKLMHQSQYTDDPRLAVQWTCGFVGYTHPYGDPRGEPFLFHFGGAYTFQSILCISLRRGIGVFVAQNQFGPRVFHLADLLNVLTNTTKIETARPSQTSSTPVEASVNIKSLAGTYVLNRTLSYGNKISKEDYVHVRYVEEIKGIEVEHWATRDNPMRYVQVEPRLFQAAIPDERFQGRVTTVSFRTSKDGLRTYLVDYNFRGDGAYRKIQ